MGGGGEVGCIERGKGWKGWKMGGGGGVLQGVEGEEVGVGGWGTLEVVSRIKSSAVLACR